MPLESKPDLPLEIGHVLFVDIVGYSKLLIGEQTDLLQHLKEMVRNSEQVRAAEATGKLIRLATGDGMALVFRNSPEAPAVCALELARADLEHPELKLRMGIHSGPINEIADLNDRINVTGAGINMAQRVMDCGDAGHILLSRRVADDLAQYRQWAPRLHDLGECEVKHGVRLHLVNLYAEQLGNAAVPEKFKKDQDAARLAKAEPAKSKFVRLVISFVVLVFIAIPALIFTPAILQSWRSKPAPTATPSPVPATAPAIPEKSIAVLPFENLSADKDDAFFADGIQDGLLTSLGQVKDLTVIARGSVNSYRGEAVAGKLREIGQKLGVANILQGSVRRSANRVVVNVQLIDARTDRQIWTQRYDRTMTDALSLQGELALEIARKLSASLTPLQQQGFATKPTENPEAYVRYLRARELETRWNADDQDHEAAAELYQQAVDLDPKFALAHARLSQQLTFLSQAKDEGRLAKALAEAEEARRLQPNLGEGRLALAHYYYWGVNDLDRASAELARAGELTPNSADVWSMRASLYRRQGKIRERIAALQQAEILDPSNTKNRADLGGAFFLVRNWAEGIRTRSRIRAELPDPKPFPWGITFAEFRRTGVLDPLKKLIAEVPPGEGPEELTTLRWGRYHVAMLERNYAAAERFLREIPAGETGQSKLMAEAFLEVARGADPQWPNVRSSKRARRSKSFWPMILPTPSSK